MLFGRPYRRLDDPVGVSASGRADQIDRSTGGQGTTHASGGQMAKGGTRKTGRDWTTETGNTQGKKALQIRGHAGAGHATEEALDKHPIAFHQSGDQGMTHTLTIISIYIYI